MKPVSIDLPEANRIGLTASLKNQSNGYGTGLVTLKVKWERESEYQEIFSDSMNFTQQLYATKTIDFPMYSGTHDFTLSFKNDRKFWPINSNRSMFKNICHMFFSV